MHLLHKLILSPQITSNCNNLSNHFKVQGNSFKMCTKATNCYLQSIENSATKVILPDKKLFALGRNEASNIRDSKVSRKQLLLKANYDDRTIKCVASGTNLSGCDGFALLENKMYTVKENSRFEVLLGTHRYDLVFEPKIESEDDELPPSKKPKVTEKAGDLSSTGTWEVIDRSLMVYTPSDFLADIPRKIAGFDMDGTLIKTKSGQRFPIDNKDWTVWSPEVKPKLQDLSGKGYTIVIFSNQLQLGNEKTRIPNFKKKIEGVIQELGVPMLAQIAMQRDINRKPAPGMWKHLTDIYPNINAKESFFVGDAAGRDKNWAPSKKKDHSNSDRLFAVNIGMKFHTPEEFFLGARPAPFQMPEFDPRTVAPIHQDVPLQLNAQEVVMMVGCQGSGKSFFCEQNIIPHDYVLVNRDMLGTKERCIKLLEQSLKEGKSVVIDNTHPSSESRSGYLAMSKKHNIPVRCFIMDVPSKQVKHNNCFRTITDTKHAVISQILINTYLKHFEKPTAGEGFDKIYELKFNPKFKSDEHEKLYKMFLMES